jgi:polyhydroxyalkanoate synthesis regulator phasin
MRTAEVNAALRARFCAPEWALFFEVGDATGAQHRRWADAVAMNLYPSRGLEIQGFEVKVSRSDWTKELKTPEKSAPVQQYCDRWWIVTPAGIVKDGELPPTWGHYEVSEGGKIRQVVAAPKLESIPVSRAFVASMMRRASGADDAMIDALVSAKIEDARKYDRTRVEREIESRSSQLEELRKLVKEFEDESGLKISSRYTGGKDIGKAVKLVLAAGIGQTYGGVQSIRNTLTSNLKELDKALAAFGEVLEVGENEDA